MALPSPADLVGAVRRHLGAPYVYGAEGPNSFDCSGLMQYAFHQEGVNIPRTAESQWAWTGFSTVQEKDLQPGDLIFSDWPGDGSSPGHVAMYSGNGKLIEAPRTGVPVHEIAFSPSYRAHVKGYKRLDKIAAVADTGTGDAGAPAGGTDMKAALAGGLSGIGSELANASKFVGALLMPATWIRVAAFVIGGGAVGAGLWMLLQEAGADSHG